MKITNKGPADTDLSKIIQNEKAVKSPRGEGDGAAKAQQSGASAKVNISSQARELQRIAELARKGDEMRAEKVQQLKQQIEAGQYKPDTQEVSKSIVRSEVARLLEKK